jgi:hypothetical protein
LEDKIEVTDSLSLLAWAFTLAGFHFIRESCFSFSSWNIPVLEKEQQGFLNKVDWLLRFHRKWGMNGSI